jgi:fatty-acyl-CoA synthase
MLAVLSMGLRYTAIHPLCSVDDFGFILDDADIDILLYRERYRPDVIEVMRSSSRDVRYVPLDERPSDRPLHFGATRASPAVTEDSVAMLTYTGGTTGRPKAVAQSHRVVNQCLLLELADWQWPRPPRLLTATPLSHGARHMVLPVLWHGGTLVVMPDLRDMHEVVRKWEINSLFVVPSILYRLLDGEYGPDATFASLRMVIYGGGPIFPQRLRDAVQRFGQVFTQLYGQSEAPLAITTLSPEDHDLSRPHLLSSCGRATPTTVVAILDEVGAPVPTGTVGEICVRGRLVMNGYWKRPRETAEALRDGWLHTGDLALSDEEGYLYILDRKKDMIVTGGFNVFSREVEDALMSHPDVIGAAVVGLRDPDWGEAVTAMVVRRRGSPVTVVQLQETVRSMKGPIHTPKNIVFADALPLTRLGKPDKEQIRAELSEQTTGPPAGSC